MSQHTLQERQLRGSETCAPGGHSRGPRCLRACFGTLLRVDINSAKPPWEWIWACAHYQPICPRVSPMNPWTASISTKSSLWTVEGTSVDICTNKHSTRGKKIIGPPPLKLHFLLFWFIVLLITFHLLLYFICWFILPLPCKLYEGKDCDFFCSQFNTIKHIGAYMK